MTGKNAESQTAYNDFVVTGRQSLGSFFTATDDDSAYLYVASGLHVYIDYHRQQKKLLG